MIRRLRFQPDLTTKTYRCYMNHSEHVFYDNPIQFQGFHCLKGESEKTWVSILACLETPKSESPESYEH